MSRTCEWTFPLPRTHTGALLANGTMGVMVWGENNHLRITVGRVDFWDHRGGMPWTEEQSYARIRTCLEQKDEEGLRSLFEETDQSEGMPRRPSVLPIGRIDLDLGQGSELSTAVLEIDTGVLAVRVRKGKKEREIRLVLDMQRPLLALRCQRGIKLRAVHRVPAWEYVGDELEAIGFDPPGLFTGGWTQMRPVDPHLGVGYRIEDSELFLSTGYGHSAQAAEQTVQVALDGAQREGFSALRKKTRSWWKRYWGDVPVVEVPNERLRLLYEYGMFKFAGLTSPQGTAATLQGAWVEEYQLPPWSNDYHFNINVQMCYWPAYHGNRLEHLRPLFELIEEWKPILRHNARVFLGIDDGFMLPHAVDDRCTCMGGFWTGSIDHGCTAWVAQMMYRYYRYTLDEKFLAERAYPFMVGAMRVYEEMLEERDGVLTLPVSVSPEYRGASMDAWGVDASFQLACIHRLCEDLLEAAALLRKQPRPIWKAVGEKLPRAALAGPEDERRIALWRGTELEESHRHHSHLAGITPFDIFDLENESQRDLIERSLADWIKTGPGLWSGWCVPWASMIHTRVGNAEAAELWLEIWERLFTNEGHGTLHDVDFPGFSLMGKGPVQHDDGRNEIMQIEAGMSCVAAIQEMLLHVRQGATCLFAGAPARWERVGFKKMRTEGAFLVSARRTRGRVGPVVVESLAGGTFRLVNPWGEGPLVWRWGKSAAVARGRIVEIEMKKGQRIRIEPAGASVSEQVDTNARRTE